MEQSQSTDTGCSEGKLSAYCRAPSEDNGQFLLKRPELPDGIQGSVFKGNTRGVGFRVSDQLMDTLLTGWW